jgi:hypothetical protein
MSRCRFTALALVLTAATAQPARAINPDYLPNDTEAVITINLRQMLGAPIAKGNKDLVDRLKALAEERLTEIGIRRYLEKIDFDLFRDLETVTIASAGGKSADFVLLEGTFNAAKIQMISLEASRDHSDTIKPILIGPQRALELRAVAESKPIYAGLVGKDKLVAASSRERFSEAVTRLNGNPYSKLKKELRDLLMSPDAPKSVHLVATGAGLAKLVDGASVNDIGALQNVLKEINVLNVGVTADKSLAFAIDVQTKDKQSTAEMVQLTSVALAGAKLLLKKNAEKDARWAPALDVVNSIHVTSQGTQFVVRGEMSAAALEAIFKNAAK